MLNLALIAARRRFIGGGVTLSAYAAGGFEPNIIADFKSTAGAFGTGYYVKDSSEVAHDSLMTVTRTGPRTVMNASGVMQWSAMNIALQSADFSTTWSSPNVTVASGATDPLGGSNADTLTATAGNGTVLQSWTATAEDFTFGVWIKRKTGTGDIQIAADNGTYTTKTITASWVLYSVEQTIAAGAKSMGIRLVTDTDAIYVWGGHLYKSSLGGMQANPNNTDGAEFGSYVPTTSAAVYARSNDWAYISAAWNGPRSGDAEPAGTNFCIESNKFDDWTVSTDSLTPLKENTGPDGLTSAWTLEDDSAGGTGGINMYQATSIATSTQHCWSFYAKQGGASHCILGLVQMGDTKDVWFDLTDGTVGTVDVAFDASGVIDVGGGWYRVWATWTTAGDGVGRMYISASESDGAETSNRDGTTNIQIYGAQVEVGGVPTSYIPTVLATVTRPVASTKITAANIASVVNTSAMSFAMKGLMTYADEGAAAQETLLRWYTDANNFITIDMDTDSADTGEINANQSVTGTLDSVDAAASYTAGVNVAFNIATRHTSGAINLAKDGTSATENATVASLADFSSDDLEIGYTGVQNTETIRGWAVDIADAGIETASS